MLVSLSEMKTYLGITDNTYDSFLTQQLSMVSRAVENYCGRKFEIGNYTQKFYQDDMSYKRSYELYTYHYPIISVSSVEDEDAETFDDYRLNKERGKLVRQDNNLKKNWFTGNKVVQVSYSAGYSDIPEDIKQVVYNLVSEAYNKKKNGIDVGFGNSVQRISVAGVMSVDYDYTLNQNERKNAFGMILGDWINVLDFYRSERALGGNEISEQYE